MKKAILRAVITCAAVIVMLLAFSAFANAEGGAVLSLTPFEVKPGEMFTTTLYLKEDSQLIDFQVRLLYDEDIVQLLDVSDERDGMLVTTNVAGRIHISFSKTSGNLTAKTDLVTFTFRADDNIGIGSVDLLAVDPSSLLEAHTMVGGELLVLAVSTDFQRLAVYEAGDVNLDSRVSIADVTYLRQYLAYMRTLTPYQLYYADAYADGVVSISDAVRIQQKLADDSILLGERLDVTFYNMDGSVYVRKSVRFGADLLTIPLPPPVQGFSNGRWSTSSIDEAPPLFTNIESNMKLYPVYNKVVSDDMNYYMERLELWYGKNALNGVLGGDLLLHGSIPYGNKHADIYWSVNNDAIFQFDKGVVIDQLGKFSRPTYDSIVTLTATIVPFDETNNPGSEGIMTFVLNVKGVFITPTKAEIENYLRSVVKQEIDSNMKLPRKVTNAEVENPSPYEVRVEWTQVDSDGIERPVTYIERDTTSFYADLVATITFNGKPLEGDGKIYFDNVKILPITENEIRTHIINSIASSLGRSISNGTSLWNDDQVFGANLVWRSKKTDDAIIENNIMQIKPEAINGTILPMEVDVTYSVDDDGTNNGARTFKLSYNIELINDSVLLVPGVNIDPELHKALKEATGTSGSLVTTALGDVKFVYLDLSKYPDITDLTGLAYCVNLRVLNISGLRVERGINEISTMNYLEALIARDCGLDNLTDGGVPVLKTAISLKLLDLSHNNFTSLNSVFAPNVRYGKLSEVYLNNNQLQDISALKCAPTLRLLAMSANGLGDEDLEAFTNFKYLMYLSLSDNHISNITPLKDLTNLIELRLHNNQIKNIKDLQMLQNLEALYLGNNEISDVTWLNNLRQLRVLYLNDNNLSDISNLNSLNRLTAVNVSGNKLNNLNVLSVSASSMVELYAENNEIPSFSFIANMTGLQRLMLAGNQFTYEPSLITNLGKLTKLKTLTISGKDLRSLSFLENMPQLTRLDANDCNLPSNSAQYLPTRLQYLDISNNGLAYTQGDTSGIYELDQLIGLYVDNMQGNVDPNQLMTLMTQLRYVSLEGCGIESTSWLSKFNKIVFVDLANNPIAKFDFNTMNQSGRKTLKYLFLDSNTQGYFEDAYYAYNGAGESPMKELSLRNLQVLDMLNLPDFENITNLDLSYTGITNLQGSKPDFAELYSIERYKTVETLDISGLQAAIAPVENLPKLETLYAVGTGEDQIFYRENILSLYRLYNKGVTAFLYSKDEMYEPVAQREGAVILGQLPDISRTVGVAADNMFSDNNPDLAASINDFPITWTVSNPVNYKVENGKLAVASYADLVDEELTLTATISVYPGQADVSRAFMIQTNILRASDAYINRVEPGGAYKRGDQFQYDITVNAAVVDGSGFGGPAKPVYTEIRYTYVGSQPWTQILTESAGHYYLINEIATLGATVDIHVAIGHNDPNAGFVVDWTNPDDPGTHIRVVSRTNDLAYYLNGGTSPGIIDGASISKAEEDVIANFVPDRPGYLFEGWFEDAVFTIPFTETTMPARDLHLYAKWKEHSYTTSFNPTGGAVSPTSKLIYCGGTYGTLPTPTREFYDFLGWFTEENGGSHKTDSTSANTTPAAETLYAHWQRRTFILNFNANGGMVSPANKTVNCGDAYGTLPTPTRDHHNCLGWYTEAVGGVLVTSSTLADNSIATKTIYAHWELKPLSDWTPIGMEPAGAQIDAQHKWRYTLTTTKKSYDTTMSGFTSISNEWVQSGTGSNWYASFPSGFDTNHSFYKNYMKSPYTASETTTTKRTVNNVLDGYIYWKWMYDCGGANAYDRVIAAKSGTGYSGFNYRYFIASISYTNYASSYSANMGTFYTITNMWQSYNESLGSRYWYRIDRNNSIYTDYKKLFTYQKIQNNLESYAIPKASSSEEVVSNIQEFIRYREK
ncbi:MAG: InlB B-repeat-containing protein [Oscillospiraceae bacterium]|nr:InlB B-repeat-containing protein [Oscillospiraceae bacterium]